MGRKGKPRRYGHGTITPVDGGRFGAYISVAGQVLRRRFRSLEEAQAWIDAQSEQASTDISSLQIRDAAAALAILPPGVSLLQCAQHYLDTRARTNADTPIAPIVETYLATRAKALRPDTMRTYRQCLSNAIADIGDNLNDYTPETVKRGIAHHTPHQHNHILRALRTFFNWCIEEHIATVNPCNGLKQKKLKEPTRAILTLNQAEQLLHAVYNTRPHLLGYFCLCMFAGLRPSEAQRIPQSAIGQEYINLPAGIVKTAQARTVPIEEGLRYILDRYPLGKRAAISIKRTRADAGIPWTQDIMRHSYASYAYERSRNASGTAYDMGHRGTDVFFRHYRGLVAPGDGAKYFAILANFAKSLQ